jgi:hypothetical protein
MSYIARREKEKQKIYTLRTALGHGQLLVKRSQAIPLERGLSNIFCHFKRE